MQIQRLISLFIGMVCGCGLIACSPQETPPSSQAPKASSALPSASSPAQPYIPAPGVMLPDFATLVEREGGAVVNISTTQKHPAHSTEEEDLFAELFKRFAPHISPHLPHFPQIQPKEENRRSLGSGFILSSDGVILTNAHVVMNSDEIKVRLTDRREFKAKLMGLDTRTDVAVLKIEASKLPAVKVGQTAQLRVGEWVVAIGSPFGFDNSVTAGIVSAKGRALPDETYVPFIQTDVAINPGNSGGPLFNMKGEVVGINSQIYSKTGGFMGVSFAIPIDLALDISKQLREKGKVSRGRLGVEIQELSEDMARLAGLDRPLGALLVRIEPESPADKAGLKRSDIVLAVNGQTLQSAKELPVLIGQSQPGSKVVLKIWRKGKAIEVSVVIAELKVEPRLQQIPPNE